MWEWLKTTQGLLAAVAAVLGIMGAWWQLGLRSARPPVVA
jgi:hypothetical protein